MPQLKMKPADRRLTPTRFIRNFLIKTPQVDVERLPVNLLYPTSCTVQEDMKDDQATLAASAATDIYSLDHSDNIKDFSGAEPLKFKRRKKDLIKLKIFKQAEHISVRRNSKEDQKGSTNLPEEKPEFVEEKDNILEAEPNAEGMNSTEEKENFRFRLKLTRDSATISIREDLKEFSVKNPCDLNSDEANKSNESNQSNEAHEASTESDTTNVIVKELSDDDEDTIPFGNEMINVPPDDDSNPETDKKTREESNEEEKATDSELEIDLNLSEDACDYETDLKKDDPADSEKIDEETSNLGFEKESSSSDDQTKQCDYERKLPNLLPTKKIDLVKKKKMKKQKRRKRLKRQKLLEKSSEFDTSQRIIQELPGCNWLEKRIKENKLSSSMLTLNRAFKNLVEKEELVNNDTTKRINGENKPDEDKTFIDISNEISNDENSVEEHDCEIIMREGKSPDPEEKVTLNQSDYLDNDMQSESEEPIKMEDEEGKYEAKEPLLSERSSKETEEKITLENPFDYMLGNLMKRLDQSSSNRPGFAVARDCHDTALIPCENQTLNSVVSRTEFDEREILEVPQDLSLPSLERQANESFSPEVNADHGENSSIHSEEKPISSPPSIIPASLYSNSIPLPELIPSLVHTGQGSADNMEYHRIQFHLSKDIEQLKNTKIMEMESLLEIKTKKEQCRSELEHIQLSIIRERSKLENLKKIRDTQELITAQQKFQVRTHESEDVSVNAHDMPNIKNASKNVDKVSRDNGEQEDARRAEATTNGWQKQNRTQQQDIFHNERKAFSPQYKIDQNNSKSQFRSNIVNFLPTQRGRNESPTQDNTVGASRTLSQEMNNDHLVERFSAVSPDSQTRSGVIVRSPDIQSSSKRQRLIPDEENQLKTDQKYNTSSKSSSSPSDYNIQYAVNSFRAKLGNIPLEQGAGAISPQGVLMDQRTPTRREIGGPQNLEQNRLLKPWEKVQGTKQINGGTVKSPNTYDGSMKLHSAAEVMELSAEKIGKHHAEQLHANYHENINKMKNILSKKIDTNLASMDHNHSQNFTKSPPASMSGPMMQTNNLRDRNDTDIPLQLLKKRESIKQSLDLVQGWKKTPVQDWHANIESAKQSLKTPDQRFSRVTTQERDLSELGRLLLATGPGTGNIPQSKRLNQLQTHSNKDKVIPSKDITGSSKRLYSEASLSTSNSKPEVKDSVTNCFVCKRPANFLCSGCETVYYCTSTCQRENWLSHYENCSKSST